MTEFKRKMIAALLYGGGIAAFAYLPSFENGALKSICDAFSLAGVMLLCYAGLSFVRAQGGFSGLGYVLKSIKNALFPFLKGERRSYKEYRESTEKGEASSIVPFLAAGLFYLAIACVLLVFYFA